MRTETLEPRVRVLQKNIIYIKELADPNPDDILHSAQETSRLGKDWDHFGIVVEFSSFVIPSLEARHKVSAEVAKIKEKLIGVAIVTRKNIVLEMACKFIYYFARFPNISIHETQDAAVKHLEMLSSKRRQQTKNTDPVSSCPV